MGLLSIIFRSRRRWRREAQVRRQESRREFNAKKRETLRKKAPTPPPEESSRAASPAREKAKELAPGAPIKAAELDAKSPVPHPTPEQRERQMQRDNKLTTALAPIVVVVDPPAECAELCGESIPHRPAPRALNEAVELPQGGSGGDAAAGAAKEFKAYSRGAAAAETCPSCLVPGFRWVGDGDRRLKIPLRSATWPYEGLSKAGALESIGPSIGFRSAEEGDDESKLNTQTEVNPYEQQQESTAVVESSSTSASETPPAISPVSPSSPLSSQTSLCSYDDNDAVVEPLSPPLRKMGSLSKATSSDKPGAHELGSLGPKSSATSLKQLRARHSLLESRRQTLLQLHRIEQEQEEILEILASMSEGDE